MSREPLVSWLDEPRTAGRGLAGGKAASLARLAGHGLPVPAGFVLTVAARAAPWDDVVPALAAAYERLGGGAVAVRSSAVAEDSPDSSFAGQFETVLGVAGLEPVAAAVRRCWRSGEADGVRRYRELRGEDGGQAAMAVLVQRMVAPWAAGVMTTLNPTTGDRSEVYVEACLGLGLGAVSGECPVDRYRVDKVRLEVRERAVVEKHSAFFAGAAGVVRRPPPAGARSAPCLTDAEAIALARLGRAIERHLGSAQDVEWALRREAGGEAELLVLQSRPETVASRRARPPAAHRGATAMDQLIGTLTRGRVR